MPAEQRFEVGYHLNTWDLGGRPLEEATAFLSETGFRWFEALVGDSLIWDFARRYMTLGDVGLPVYVSDVDLLRRWALFSRTQSELGLCVSSLYAKAEFVNPALWPYERDLMQATARFLQGCGSRILVCGGGPPASSYPHDPKAYSALASSLQEIGAYTKDLGIDTVYHPHLDCFVETREQLDRFMDVVDTDLVGLCIDPAHLQLGGADPVDALRTYIDHVRYVHFKDCRGEPASLDGPERYASFCELGAGAVDMPALTEVLLSNAYDGLVVIELDASEKTAEESCLESVEYITKKLGLRLTLDE
jgi:inosose dehydratase